MASKQARLKERVNTNHRNTTSTKTDPTSLQHTSDSADREADPEFIRPRNISTKGKAYKCSICLSKFRNLNAFGSHMRYHNVQQKMSSNDLNGATENHIKTGPLKIPKAKRQYSRSNDAAMSNKNAENLSLSKKKLASEKLDRYPKPLESLQKTKTYTCIGCKETFNDIATLKCHTCTTKPQRYKCQTCSQYFKTLYRLKIHESSIHSNSELFTCPYCDQTFTLRNSKNRHIKTMHKDLASPIPTKSPQKVRKVYAKCEFCKREFTTKFSRDRHINTFHYDLVNKSPDITDKSLKGAVRKKDKYFCKICNKAFKYKGKRDNHVYTIHKNLEDSQQIKLKSILPISHQYICPFCKRVFGSKGGRDLHVQVVHEKLINSLSLRELLDINKGTAPDGQYNHDKNTSVYTCSQCNATFSKEYMLRKHVMKVHWKEDNKLNKIKQTAKKKKKINSGEIATTNTSESQSCEFDDDDDVDVDHDLDVESVSDVITEIKKQSHTEDVPGVVNVSISSGIENTDTCEIPKQSPISVITKAIRAKLKTMNKKILLDQCVATERFGPCRRDPISNRLVYVCIICKTTYLSDGNFFHHVQRRAYDHGFYLKKRKKPKTNNGHPPNSILKYRFECDVCQDTFNRKFSLICHRLRHNKDEFKKSGAREDVYKSPCGKIIINLDNYFETVDKTEQEISSTTNKEQPHEEESGRLAIYLERPDDHNSNINEKVIAGNFIDTEGLSNAGSASKEHIGNIITKTNETNDNTKIIDNSRIFAGHSDSDKTSLKLKKQNTISNVTKTSQNKTNVTKPTIKISNTEQSKIGRKTCKINPEPCSVRNENISTLHIASVQGNISSELFHTHTIRRMPNICPGEVQDTGTETIQTTTNNDEHERQQEQEQIEIHTMTYQFENDCINTPIKSENMNQEEIPNELPFSRKLNISVIEKEKDHNEDNTRGIPIVNTQGINLSVPIMGQLTSEDDKKKCIACEITLQNEHDFLSCKLCDKIFCINCADIPSDIYNILFGADTELAEGIMWTCSICKQLVPKFSVLLSQLGDFEHIINNRLTEMEQKMTKMGQ